MERDTESKLVCYSLTSSHHVLVLDCEILEVRDPDLLISVPIHHCPPMPSMVPDSQLLNGDSEDGHRKKKQEGNPKISQKIREASLHRANLLMKHALKSRI